jgi:hypothetical protein
MHKMIEALMEAKFKGLDRGQDQGQGMSGPQLQTTFQPQQQMAAPQQMTMATEARNLFIPPHQTFQQPTFQGTAGPAQRLSV